MDLVANSFMPGDQHLVDKIVYELKSQGIFDQFRKECFADVDTKPAYQNLRQRVEGSVNGFLRDQSWKPDMNKNQVREMLRRKITESGYLETGVERIVDQVVNPKITSVFLPKVEQVVLSFLGIKQDQEETSGGNDLLPKDLEAVSPESKKDTEEEVVVDVVEEEETQDSDASKVEEDESPPFEPLDEPHLIFMSQEDNSVDSHVSQDSNQLQIEQQDSQMSRNSSDSRLSIVTSDDNSKIDQCDDSQSKSSDHSTSRKNEEKNRHRSDKSYIKSYSSSGSRDKERKDKSSSSRRDRDRSRQSSRHSSGNRSRRDSTRDKDKDKDKRSSSLKSRKDRDKDRDRYRHSSSSHRTTSTTSKKKTRDDHYASKDKGTRSRRSHDRDSNDGSTNPSQAQHGSQQQPVTNQQQQQQQDDSSHSQSQSTGDQVTTANLTAVEQSISSGGEIVLNDIEAQLAKMESGGLEEEAVKKEEEEQDDFVLTPPLVNTVISQDNWDAMEEKLRQEVGMFDISTGSTEDDRDEVPPEEQEEGGTTDQEDGSLITSLKQSPDGFESTMPKDLLKLPLKKEVVKKVKTQRYSSDDLYKPRLTFPNCSRRNRANKTLPDK